MELTLSNTLLAGDPRLVDHIVGEVKSQGIFDQFRKECIADVDTKPAYQNLHTRVEGSVYSFLNKQTWKPDLNKNQLRETLRKQINEASFLDAGVERIVDQVVNPKIYSVFMPEIEDVVYKFLGIERPKPREKNGACGLKDLLPKDLDPVSPESDKNSLKDVSLESVDALDELEIKKDLKLSSERKSQCEEISDEKVKDNATENGQIPFEEKVLDESDKTLTKTGSNLNLNTSGKSDDKTEEDEEDSPTFEPIDIMNLNESNNSNDSHLSGISELTSHRSRSPEFCNELSRDNFEYSNQDSQLSKVSSDSRLSIITDFGSSNHASTPLQDALKDETSKDKCDVKNIKDNFKAIRECDTSKNKTNNKNIFELNKNKDVQDIKDSKNIKSNLSSKENSRDATDSSVKDKNEHKSNKDRSRDSESKSRSRDKNYTKDGKHRDRSSDKKKEKNHSSSKYDKSDKSKGKEKNDQSKESTDKTVEKDIKTKEEKAKETDKKDSINKESKDLKDLYKEKIRELREKKELTEKEKLNKDIKESKSNKENKDKKDSLKDKKAYKKDHKSSSKNSSSSSHELKTVKSSEKIVDGREKRSESKDKDKDKDKGKREERRSSKDHIKSKNYMSSKSDSTEKLDKQDVKKFTKSEKDEKTDKSEVKKDIKSNNEKLNGKKENKTHTQSKGSSRNENKKDSKDDSQHKNKKRREEKKSKSKDDHSSLRRNSNDRRSTDRDGSNGSSSKSSQSSNFNSNNNKSNTSTFSKETNHISNSGSETSDNIEEVHTSDLNLLEQQSYKLDKVTELQTEYNADHEMHSKQESEFNSVNLPLKKRALLAEDKDTLGTIKVKKPKFAKNIHEAKKLMKIRKQIEKQKLKEKKKLEKKLAQKTEEPVQSSAVKSDDFESMPDEERVQIIEIPDEEYEEPYPEKHSNITLEEKSIMMLQTKDLLETHSKLKYKLSDMELCIKQSLDETLCDKAPENESAQQSSLDAQTNPSDNKGTEGLQNKDSLSFRTEGTDSNTVIKIEKIEETFSKNETQKENDKFKEPVMSQEEIAGDNIQKVIDKETKQSNTNIDDASFSGESKNAEMPTTSKSIDKISSEVSENGDSDLERDVNDEVCVVRIEVEPIESTSSANEDNEDCRYFSVDNEKSEKFSNYLESLKLVKKSTLEDIIESLGGQVVSSMPKAMAPPLPKRKHSSSPLMDILLNNTNNNNDGHTKALNSPNEEAINCIKKRKLVMPKKRIQLNTCAPQGLLNGENFVMPLSPESDVSATSEKIPSSNLIKEDKSRQRSSQRYSSDDLYKPRPLFSSSSRRSRRSNQV